MPRGCRSESPCQGNVELVRSRVDRWNSGDREVREDEIDPGMELVTRMMGSPLRGPDRVSRATLRIPVRAPRWEAAFPADVPRRAGRGPRSHRAADVAPQI
jgi:hypothetical protein